MRIAAGFLLSGALLVAAAAVGIGGTFGTAAGVVLLVIGAFIAAAALEAADAMSPLANGLDELEALTAPQPVDPAT